MKTINDFSKITFIGIDGVGTDVKILKSLIHVHRSIPNSKYLFLTSGTYEDVPGIQQIKIQKLNYDDFSKFCLLEMKNYIDTEYMINCHGDGFVVNPYLWNPDFMNYDYIGAPWPSYNLENSCRRWGLVKDAYEKSYKSYKIGNGGFSIRSKKLLEEVSHLYRDEYYGIPEDLVISIIMRKELENRGCKFTDSVPFAGSFSCEAKWVDGYIISSDTSFGFHCGGTHPDKVKLLETV